MNKPELEGARAKQNPTESAMILAAFIATWWAGIGVAVGASRATTFPGPQDSPTWAVLWAVGWPVLWLCEEPRP